MSGVRICEDEAAVAEIAAWADETAGWLGERVERGRARRGKPQPIEAVCFRAEELDSLLSGFRLAAAALGALAPAMTAPAPVSATPPASRALPDGWRVVK
jgi:hypothetical protein